MTQPRHPTRDTIWEIDERKRKHAYWKLLQPGHPTRDTMWETKEETCKRTCCKVIQPRHPRRDTMRETNVKKCTQEPLQNGPRHPAGDTMQETNVRCKKWKHSRTKWSGQSVQQQRAPCGRQMKKQCKPSAKWFSHSKCIQQRKMMRETKN